MYKKINYYVLIGSQLVKILKLVDDFPEFTEKQLWWSIFKVVNLPKCSRTIVLQNNC